ncbi:MAG: hypothetical protein JXR58_05255, partial [Bacteroidales bacterium]|nr:hypothetical protein [Bacteroidales bacterium]
MEKKLFILMVLLTGIIYSHAQYTLSGDDGTTIYTNSGTVNLGSYTPGQLYEITICSDDPMCSHINILIDTWTIGSGNFCVYDGNSDGFALLG